MAATREGIYAFRIKPLSSSELRRRDQAVFTIA
jgi:hypothetical protein